MEESDAAMGEKEISRQTLLYRLRRAAMVRSIITMLSMLPILLVLGILLRILGEPQGAGGLMVLYFVLCFGGPAIVSGLITHFYCRREVTCPYCGNSLWSCGTGNFKPRKMRIRRDAQECSRCHAKLT